MYNAHKRTAAYRQSGPYGTAHTVLTTNNGATTTNTATLLALPLENAVYIIIMRVCVR